MMSSSLDPKNTKKITNGKEIGKKMTFSWFGQMGCFRGQIQFIDKIKSTLIMDSLLMSRMKKDVSPSRLYNLSPDKYGKAAWADLTYTPAKLAENVIFREATTLKKHEQGNNKLREFEAMNDFMKERLLQTEQERDGIQISLSQQISMYKKMYNESQIKHESRLKEIQKRFCTEISMLISQKEEEAKYSQSEKEMLEERIAELEERLREAQQREQSLNNSFGGLKGVKEKVDLENEHLNQKLCQFEKDRAIQQDQWKRSKEDQKKKAKESQKSSQEQIQNLITEKTREKEVMDRLMRTELEKLENIRTNQNFVKTQEMRDIMTTFDSQTKRLNETIAIKDRAIDALSLENAKNKQSLVDVTTKYENKVNCLSHKGNDLNFQLDKYAKRISDLEKMLEVEMSSRAEEREHLGRTILELKDELQRTEVAFVRERDKYEYWGSDLEKENIFLKTQNKRTAQIFEENESLASEIQNLRSLLMESSYQIEKSKEELMKLSYERDTYAIKMENVLGENERLYRMKRQIEEDAASQWRNAYTTQRQIFR